MVYTVIALGNTAKHATIPLFKQSCNCNSSQAILRQSLLQCIWPHCSGKIW